MINKVYVVGGVLRIDDATGAVMSVEQYGTWSVDVANFPATYTIVDGGGSITIDAASLPLPTGASTEATLAAASAKLPASLGTKTAANSLSVVTASDSYPLPYESAVALDLVSGAFAETRNGRNPDVDTAGEEDLWNVGGLWVPITAAQTISVVSASAADTAAGTGARTALLRGLDGSYNRISETITLNGVTPVVSVNQYIFVSDLEVLTTGSGGTNAGQITGTATTDATIQFRMAATDGRTQLSWYMVPAGYSALCHGYFMSMNNTAAGAVIRAEFKIKQFGRTFVTRGYASTRNDGNGQAFVPFIPPLKLPEKTIVKVSATSGTNNSDVQVTYGLSMRAN